MREKLCEAGVCFVQIGGITDRSVVGGRSVVAVRLTVNIQNK